MSDPDQFEAAGVVFVNPRGEVLLHLRDDIPTIRFPNYWGLIGGQVEDGESPEEALRREAIEEIDEILGEVSYWGHYESEPPELLPRLKLHIFVAALDKPAESLPLTEGQCVRWFAPAEALKLALVPSVQSMLPRFVDTELYRSFCADT